MEQARALVDQITALAPVLTNVRTQVITLHEILAKVVSVNNFWDCYSLSNMIKNTSL